MLLTASPEAQGSPSIGWKLRRYHRSLGMVHPHIRLLIPQFLTVPVKHCQAHCLCVARKSPCPWASR